MITEFLAPFAFGAQFGAWGAIVLIEKFKRPTYEERLGTDILAAANRARFRLRFAPGCVASQSFTLTKDGERDVQITISASRPDFEEVSA